MVTEERHRALLIRQNPWWQGKKTEIHVFERDLLSKIQKYIKYKQILAITGLRRVGKTTIMKQVIQGLDAPKKNICVTIQPPYKQFTLKKTPIPKNQYTLTSY